MTANKGTKKLVRIQKPKHKEAMTLKESAIWQPWKVTLKVLVNRYDPPVDYVVYVRSKEVDEVQWFALQMFTSIEFLSKGKNPNLEEFPCLYNGIEKATATAEVLSDQDYFEALKEGKTYEEFYSAGPKDNPSCFVFKRPGWDKNSSIIDCTNAIIVP